MKKNKKNNVENSEKILEILDFFGHFLCAEELRFISNDENNDELRKEYLKQMVKDQMGDRYDSNFRFSFPNDKPNGVAVHATQLGSVYDEDRTNEKLDADRRKELKELRKQIKKVSLDELREKLDQIEQAFVRCTALDTYTTDLKFKSLKKALSSNSDLISVNNLLLYYAFRSQIDLHMFTNEEEIYAGRINRYKVAPNFFECYYGNGDSIISEDGGKNWERVAHRKFPDQVEPFNRKKMCSTAIMQMFKAHKELDKSMSRNDKKKRFISLSKRKYDQFELTGGEYNFSSLTDALQTKTVWHNIDYIQIDEWINNGLITREEIIQAFEKGLILPRDIAIMNELGILPDIKEKTQENPNVQKGQLFAKLLLYTTGKAEVEKIEEFLVAHPEQREYIDEDMIQELSLGFHKYDVRFSLYSLLVHDILDYDQSMMLIDKIKKDGKLGPEDEEYLKKGIHDFKINQLENMTQVEEVEAYENHRANQLTTRGRLTIDPNLRIEYFKSIGSVKSIFIDGSALINDEQNNKRRNSLDGYQLLIIPEKGVAVLEKFFETEHKNGKVVYKKDKAGNLIPTIENATFVMPIEKAVEYAKRGSKRDLTKRRICKKMLSYKKLE